MRDRDMTGLRILLVAGLLLAATACGEGTGDSPPGPEPAERQTHPLAFGPDVVGLVDWEWYRVFPEHHDEFRGRVVDPGGAPVAGASVELVIMPMRPTSSPRPIDAAKTGDDGGFRFENVPVNAWVRTAHPDWAGRFIPVGQALSGDEPGRLAFRPGTFIAGTLRLPDGTPVPDWPIQASNFQPDWSVLVRTNDQGRYSIERAPAGTIGLSPLPGRYGTRGPIVEVKPGNPIELDITVREYPAVTGLVLDAETRKPVGGAVVTSMVRKLEHGLTDAEGRFRIEGMCQPMILVRAEGYAEGRAFADPERTAEQALLPILLEKGSRVRGRVLDFAGNAVGGARVNAFLDPSELRLRVQGPLTAPDGTFDFSWLPLPKEGGSIVFTALAPGCLATPGAVLPFSPDRPLGDLELRVHRPILLRLRLLDDDGAPISGANVEVDRRSGPNREPRDHVWPGGIGLSGADGRVRIGGLGEGSHGLIIRAKERLRVVKEVELVAEEDMDLGDLTLETRLVVHGRVVSEEGVGLVGGRLTITRLGTLTFERIDARPDGSFRLAGFTPGPLSIHAEAPGYEPRMIDGKAGGPEIEIALKQYGRLELLVVRSEEARSPGRIVAVRVEGGKPRSRSLPRDQDRHDNPVFPAGDWWIRVEVEGWYGLMGVTVLPGRVAKLEMELERGAVFAGRLTGPDGKGIPEAGIEFETLELAGRDEGPEAWGTRSTTTDPNGSFLLRVVPPGRVKLRTHPPGYPPREEP